MSCHDHRPGRYISRGGGFGLYTAFVGRNDWRIRQVAAGKEGRHRWQRLSESAKQPRDHDRQRYRHRRGNDCNLQDAQAACASV
jgi:hypothetical protein